MPLSILVTGFLGSGKTTFVLRSLVERYKDRNLGILVNDFGEVGYDRLRFYSENIGALGVDGLCLCCEGVGELLRALETLKGVDLLVLETSGLSDPYPLMRAMEEAGYGTPMVVCLLPVDSWRELRQESVFRAQLEYADCVVISRCDLSEDPGELRELLKGRPAFLCYEGKVEEDFFTFFEGKPPERKSSTQSKSGHAVRESFSQITIKPEGFYSMEELENFLRRLPSQVVRVKGFVRVLESPLPMGLNWTKNHLSWEAV
ncbi:MAG: GTP-binding protein, partial [Aquificaceae bacterium]